MRKHRTHLSRAARTLSARSELTYAQALARLRAAGGIPDLDDPAAVAAFVTDGTSSPAPASGPLPRWVRWADADGDFALADGSFGNPGCDGCGSADAIACVDGRYLCQAAADAVGLVRAGTNTAVDVTYADADNYKQHRRFVFPGMLTDAGRAVLVDALDGGIWFIPTQVGLPHLGADAAGWRSFPTDADHVWHELEVTVCDDLATEDRSIGAFVDAVVAADWDDSVDVADVL